MVDVDEVTASKAMFVWTTNNDNNNNNNNDDNNNNNNNEQNQQEQSDQGRNQNNNSNSNNDITTWDVAWDQWDHRNDANNEGPGAEIQSELLNKAIREEWSREARIGTRQKGLVQRIATEFTGRREEGEASLVGTHQVGTKPPRNKGGNKGGTTTLRAKEEDASALQISQGRGCQDFGVST